MTALHPRHLYIYIMYIHTNIQSVIQNGNETKEINPKNRFSKIEWNVDVSYFETGAGKQAKRTNERMKWKKNGKTWERRKRNARGKWLKELTTPVYVLPTIRFDISRRSRDARVECAQMLKKWNQNVFHVFSMYIKWIWHTHQRTTCQLLYPKHDHFLLQPTAAASSSNDDAATVKMFELYSKIV